VEIAIKVAAASRTGDDRAEAFPIPYDRIRELVSSLPVVEVPAALVDAARVRSGALQDDIAVLVATTME